MIYTVSKNTILILCLFSSLAFSLADTNLSNYWSAEGRDMGMLREETQDFACKIKNGSCCKGNICMGISVNCAPGTSPVMKGCNEKCSPIVICKKEKIIEAKIDKKEEIKVDKSVLKKFNIEIENETKEEIRNKVKTVKIEKIDDMGTKLQSIIEQTEALNYNSYKLKVYIQNLNNIKYGLNQDNLTSIETKKYNTQLKNIMNSIKQELSNIKNTYNNQ